jgi:hypothetical protein
MKQIQNLLAIILIISILIVPLAANPVAAASAIISVTPNSGPVHALIEVIGSGFTANTSFSVKFDGLDFPYCSGNITSNGSLYKMVGVPELTRGVHSIMATTTSDQSNEVSFNVTPVIYLSSQSGTTGSYITVNGYGFNANTSVTVSFDDLDKINATTNLKGSFHTSFIVPQTNLGIHMIKARDAIGAAPPTGYAVTYPNVTLTGWGTATIDGVFSLAEWDTAGSIDFPVYLRDGGATTGKLYVMNDQNNLFLAAQVVQSSLGAMSQIFFEFDNDNDDVWPEAGDDCVILNQYGFFDDYRDANGNGPSDTQPSSGPPGTNDGQGACANNGHFTTFELSHPLDSADDAHDFNLKAGDTVGFFFGLNVDWGQLSQFSAHVLVIDGTLPQNNVSASYQTQYTYGISGDNLTNNAVSGTKTWLTNCWNDKDITDAVVASPRVTLYTGETFNSLSPIPNISATPPYQWSFADIPENRGAIPTVTQINKTFTPGFEVSRSITPYHVSANATQYLTINVTVREPASQLMVDIYGTQTASLTSLISKVSAGDAVIDILDDKSYAWVSVSAPPKDASYEIRVELDTSLRPGIISADFMPRINIRLRNSTAKYEAMSGGTFVHDIPGLGTWCWSAAGCYRWSSSDDIVRSIELSSRTTPGVAATLSLVTRPETASSVDDIFLTQPIMRVADQFGNPMGGVAVTASRSKGTGVLRGTLTVSSNTTGLATFNNLGYNKSDEAFAIRFMSGSLTIESGLLSPLAAGKANQVRVETTANGTGTIVLSQSMLIGSKLTAYSITRDQFNNFVANAAADTWSLVNKTGNVVDSNLIAGIDNKSAQVTANATGTAIIHASITGLSSVNSETIIVTTPTNSGGGGGGYVAPAPTPKPLALSGLSAASDLYLDVFGKAQSAAQLKTTDGNVTLDIAGNTILIDANSAPLKSFSAKLLTSPPQPPPQNVILLAYEFGPEGAIFNPPITLTLSIDPQKVPEGVVRDSVSLVYWDGSKWVIMDSKIELATGTITAPISHFSQYALIAKYVPPAKFSLSDLKLSSNKVNPGEMITIQTTVSNTGGSIGKYTSILKINDTITGSKDMTLEAGNSQSVTFTISKDIPGDYAIDINGKTAIFIVTAPVIEKTPEISLLAIQPIATPVPTTTLSPLSQATVTPTTIPEKKPGIPLMWPIIGIIVIALIIGGVVTWQYRKHP